MQAPVVLITLLIAGFAQSATAQVTMEQVFSNLQFERPVSLRNNGTDRLFVVEQFGKIMTFQNEAQVAETTVFLDIQDRVVADEQYIEAGLLGLAFHPNYADNGYFYVNYITEDPLRTVVSRFERLATDSIRADPNSEVILLEIEQPTHNHNAGDLAFTSDGYLYIALGDGSRGNDTFGNGQNLETLLGAVLRIDVDNPTDGLNYGIPSDNPFAGNDQGYREEIYAYGFRNPWRFSFDAETGELWLGDVGETAWEEIDLVTAGGNYGWPITEGPACYRTQTCDQTDLTLPIWTYDHEIGRAITGGYVYRGRAASELYGAYIYADWAERKVWMLQPGQENNPVNIQLDTPTKFFSGFGEDKDHELYAVSYFTGEIYRFHGTPTDTKSLSTQRYVPVELTLTSDRTYAHPHQDVQVEAVFEGPRQQEITVAGFWDGGTTYRVRFAPPEEGFWRYRTRASDTQNAGLHGQHGDIEVAFYTGDDPFATRGWLRVSDDRRSLSYGDGTPFFYLGDTAWEITWKSFPDQVEAYLDDRRRKGFNAVQIVVMSHQRLHNDGVRNRAGQPFFLDNNFSRLNPRYFDYLDWIVEQANGRGMVAVLVPLWAYMMELYPESGPQRSKLSEAESLLLARYVGARYAGHNVLWIVGGDNQYDTPERQAFWTTFAITLDEASGGRHLVTLHPRGFRGSFDYFDNETAWLDFHMYQSSHIAGSDYPQRAAARGYKLEPPKPVLNGEAAYEDIYHNLWQPGDPGGAESFRIRPEHVRQASYMSVLSGALVGMAYGANGVWQWHTESLRGSHFPRVPVEQAWQFPGSTHLGILKQLMVRFRWYELVPRPGWIIEKDTADVLPLAASEAYALAYFSEKQNTATIDFSRLGERIAYFWIDPSTSGVTESITTEEQPVTVQKPYGLDWLLVAQRLASDSEAPNPGGITERGQRFTADLDATKEVDVETAPVNGMVHYTVWIENLGPHSTAKVQVADHLPECLIDATWVTTRGAYDGWLWDIGAIKVGETVKLEVWATVGPDCSGTVTNQAWITRSSLPDPSNFFNLFDEPPPTLLNNHAEASFDVETGANGRVLDGKTFALGNNYPNPFNPTTLVPFSLAEAAHVSIRVYDMLGREVSVLVDGQLSAGVHEVVFEANNLPTGVYLIRMKAAGTVQIQQVTLMK